ncbi:MAG: class II aldolase/adducin family protein [Deltaproteobacteria bacterium]|nr:class II aldolase/adducin family protein [Deltaproteobacteria bacterium]MBI3294236.1 class II aldolase/adducin family protein [Deltaproteobacteria bacterium]
MTRETAQAQLSEMGRWLSQKNYLAAADGNFSLKDEGDTFWITASGVNKGYRQPIPLAEVAIDGRVRSGEPSSETEMHCAVFRRCPKARAVIHAHPPTLVAWSIARPELTELTCDSFSEAILAVGSIPIVPFARPGGLGLAGSILPFLPLSRAMVLGRHGALAWGETLEEALNGIERMEHAAIILATAERLGGAKALPQAEIDWLKARRQELGEKTL